MKMKNKTYIEINPVLLSNFITSQSKITQQT